MGGKCIARFFNLLGSFIRASLTWIWHVLLVFLTLRPGAGSWVALRFIGVPPRCIAFSVTPAGDLCGSRDSYDAVLRLADFQSVKETHLLFPFSSPSITAIPKQLAHLGSDILQAAVRTVLGCVFRTARTMAKCFYRRTNVVRSWMTWAELPEVVSSARPAVTDCFNVGTPEKYCSWSGKPWACFHREALLK